MSDFHNTFGNDSTFQDPELQELASGLTLCGKYRLEQEAGVGGMGVVWKAWDDVGGRWVALKFIPPEIRHSDGAMEQVKTVFQTVQALNHTNIGPLYGLEKDETFGYFIVKKWLEGKPLSKTQLSQEQIPNVLAKVADALDYAHEKRVMHRDVKPSNIFIETNGDVFLIDFGIAAEIQNSISQNTSSTVCRTSGTRPYMAPEQWRGQYQDGQTDQYALGVVAYQLYSGHLPFENPDLGLLCNAVMNFLPDAIPDVPPAVNAAIQRALSKDRKDRFASCREFVDALAGTTLPGTPIRKDGGSSSATGPAAKTAIDQIVEAARLAEETKRRAEDEARKKQIQALDELAAEEYQSSRYEEAIAHLNELLQLKPDHPNAKWLLNSATQKLEAQKKEEAERKTREAAERKAEAERKAREAAVRKIREEAERNAREEAERKAREEAKRKALVEALRRNWKGIAVGVLMLLVVLAAVWGWHLVQEQREEQNRIEQAVELQKNTAPNGETRMVLKTDDGIEYAFVWCPPGEFMMGSINGESDEKPAHKVTLTKGFWMLETEVTQAMWQSVMGENPSRFKGDRNPVECVSWDKCQEFCRKLSQKLELQVQLPTEAQWEYACRAGTTGDYAGNLDDMAWYTKNGGPTHHDVGQKKPNAWGLYDMHGNVWEWCSDYYDEQYYYRAPTNDPENTEESPFHVSRGGSWFNLAEFCRSALHGWNTPFTQCSDLGFRVLLVPSQE